MGEVILHVGDLGQGQTVKVINNAVGATNCATLAQALVVGKATGVDLRASCEVMGASSGASTMVTLKAGPMLEHDYTPLFQLEHMLKDVRLCLAESEAAGVPFPAAALARELYAAAMGRGLGDAGLRGGARGRRRALAGTAGSDAASANRLVLAVRCHRFAGTIMGFRRGCA